MWTQKHYYKFAKISIKHLICNLLNILVKYAFLLAKENETQGNYSHILLLLKSSRLLLPTFVYKMPLRIPRHKKTKYKEKSDTRLVLTALNTVYLSFNIRP